MGLASGEQTLAIEATPEQCFEAIVDYESFPEWQDAVESVEVIERDAEGRGRIVELHVDAKFRTVRYRLHYHYDAPNRVWWDFIEGDGVEAIEGEYLLEPAGAGPHADYRLWLDAGIPIPGLIARRLNGQVLKRAAEDLKREAERRAEDR
ncbi:MAG: SRPBCC family protein [Solirubrobacterales bacterium]